MSRAIKLLLIVGVLSAMTVAVLPAPALATTSCRKIEDPYKGTRYEGVDLRRIRAQGVGCPRARRVVRGAHYKALGLPVEPVRHYHWHGWRVRGDIRGPVDHYRALKGGAVVRWVF